MGVVSWVSGSVVSSRLGEWATKYNLALDE